MNFMNEYVNRTKEETQRLDQELGLPLRRPRVRHHRLAMLLPFLKLAEAKEENARSCSVVYTNIVGLENKNDVVSSHDRNNVVETSIGTCPSRTSTTLTVCCWAF